MKHIKVKTVTYIDFDIESNDKNFKFQVCDSLKISTYKNIFAKFQQKLVTPKWSEEVFVIKKS